MWLAVSASLAVGWLWKKSSWVQYKLGSKSTDIQLMHIVAWFIVCIWNVPIYAYFSLISLHSKCVRFSGWQLVHLPSSRMIVQLPGLQALECSQNLYKPKKKSTLSNFYLLGIQFLGLATIKTYFVLFSIYLLSSADIVAFHVGLGHNL